MHLHLVHLYPKLMNTYGDTGNITCLAQRCRWRGIQVTVHPVEAGDPIPPEASLYFFGGGQDAAQGTLGKDLEGKASRIKEDVGRGVPLLAICGGYQLLGYFYAPFHGDPIPGIGLFPVETHASHDRMINNLVISLDPAICAGSPNTAVGFENHSGKSTLTDRTAGRPFGKVLYGSGNNGSDGTEGCITGNAIGCYMHGSLLPKNPHVADWLLSKAISLVDPSFALSPLDDRAEWEAHHYIVGRYTRGER